MIPTPLPPSAWSGGGALCCFLCDAYICVSVGFLGLCQLCDRSVCECVCVQMRHLETEAHASLYQGLVDSRAADGVRVGGQLRAFGLNSVSVIMLNSECEEGSRAPASVSL